MALGKVAYATIRYPNKTLVNVSFVDSDRSMLDENTLLRLLLLLWMMMPAAKDPAARRGYHRETLFSVPGGKSSGAPLILRHGQLGTLYGAAATRTKKKHNSQNVAQQLHTPNPTNQAAPCSLCRRRPFFAILVGSGKSKHWFG
jgi:hypothetical protein